jgi:MYXO-CTERM domain-containing protein
VLKGNRRRAFLGVVCALVAAAPEGRQPRGFETRGEPEEALKTGIAFEANLGQFDPEVLYASKGKGYALWLTASGAKLSLSGPREDPRSETIELVTGGAKTIAPASPLPGKVSYFRGQDPAGWVTSAPTFGRVTYAGVQRGIDLVYRGGPAGLEYDFIVQSGASPRDAVLEVRGTLGLSLDAGGALLLRTRRGVLRQPPPNVYQMTDDGVRRSIEGAYRIVDGSRIAFAVEDYDASRALVIDPVLLYGTYLGGSAFDQASAVAVDGSGNVYVSGFTASTDFPTESPLQGKLGGSLDAFVAKLDPSGRTLLYATYLGGSLEDSASAIAVDGSGRAFISGRTQSLDFPITKGAFQPFLAGASNAFVAKLSAAGDSLDYATYLGGMGFDAATSIALDSTGDAYLAGYTQSPDFPTMAPFQSTLDGPQNAFVAELAPDGGSLLSSTYLGGSANDQANAVAIDSLGAVWVAGYAQSGWQVSAFPNRSPFQSALAGAQNAFLTRFAPGLGALEGTTFVGGSREDAVNAIAIDASGNVLLTGATSSPDFPTVKAVQRSLEGDEDAFVTKVSSDLSSLVYSTFLGGTGNDLGSAVGVAASGEAFVAGQTSSENFPVLGAFQDRNEGADTPLGNAFLTILGPSGATLIGSSYLGGQGGAGALGLALGSAQSAWIVGSAGSGFPVAHGLFPTYSAEGSTGTNAFAASLSSERGIIFDGGDSTDAGLEPDAGPPQEEDGGGVQVIGPSIVPLAPTGGSDTSCGCRAGSRTDASPAAGAVGLLAFAFVYRRRRKGPAFGQWSEESRCP